MYGIDVLVQGIPAKAVCDGGLIDTKIIGFAPWLAERVQDFRDIPTGTPAAAPSAPVMAPRERESKSYASARNDGVAVTAGDLAALKNLAGEP